MLNRPGKITNPIAYGRKVGKEQQESVKGQAFCHFSKVIDVSLQNFNLRVQDLQNLRDRSHFLPRHKSMCHLGGASRKLRDEIWVLCAFRIRVTLIKGLDAGGQT